MTGSRTVTIGELVSSGDLFVTDGYRTKRAEHGRPGFRIIRVADVDDGRVSIDGPDFVSERFQTQIGAKLGQPGDIVVTTKGTVGRVAVYNGPADVVVYSPQLCVFRVLNSATVDAGYLRYWFDSPAFRYQASYRKGNTDMADYINLVDIKSLKVDVPHLHEQRAIAEVLGALDDKISADRRERITICRLVPALFRSMPGSDDYCIKLTDFVAVTKGVSYRSADLVGSEMCLVTLKSVGRDGSYQSGGLKPYAGSFKPAQEIHPGDVVVAQTDLTQAASVVGRVVRVPHDSRERKLVASLDLAVVRPVGDVPAEFVFGVLLDAQFREHCRARTSGTTVLHLAADAFSSYLAPSVPSDDQMKFAGMVRPMLSRQDSLLNEIEALTSLRDTLLPALMSGKLRVRDAEKSVEAVV